MSLDVWFKEDIKNTLLALDEANNAIAQLVDAEHDHELGFYRDGYRDALRAVAIAFGIVQPSTPLTQEKWAYVVHPSQKLLKDNPDGTR